MPKRSKAQATLVKWYSGGRLYDATHLCYVSVEQLRHWVSAGLAFSVIDAASGADVKAVLLA
jgi:polyhydroxyalkanoate synthesis regulator protein